MSISKRQCKNAQPSTLGTRTPAFTSRSFKWLLYPRTLLYYHLQAYPFDRQDLLVQMKVPQVKTFYILIQMLAFSL